MAKNIKAIIDEYGVLRPEEPLPVCALVAQREGVFVCYEADEVPEEYLPKQEEMAEQSKAVGK